jgi:hypothetical protein
MLLPVASREAMATVPALVLWPVMAHCINERISNSKSYLDKVQI